MLQALGGAANIISLDACMTRLRLAVRDPGALDEARLRQMGAAAVVRPGGGDVQVVMGARAGELAQRIRAAAAGTATKPTGPEPGATPVSAPAGELITLLSPITGRVVPLDQVPDPVFAGRLAGDGVAVEATDGLLLAPAAGRVMLVFPGGHALGLATPEGLELLVHVGLDTVELHGQGFSIAVAEGDEVAAGDLLGRFDPAHIRAQGKSLLSPVLVTNPEVTAEIAAACQGATVRAGEPLLTVRRKL